MLFPKDGRENQVEFLCFPIKLSSFRGQFWLRRRNHSKEMFCFLRPLDAAANGIAEIFLRYAFVCLAVVRANARTAADELIN